jgi:4-alpha-glucanotransferase
MPKRTAGLLLHPTSLPGRFGVGTLGAEAHAFLDRLQEAGLGLWQVLPLGPTGYGDSPYQCFSSFAGNPLLVDLDDLVQRGWLDEADLADAPDFPEAEVDYGAVLHHKMPLLERAWVRFRDTAPAVERAAFDVFCTHNAPWLDDFALFSVAKSAHHGVAWNRWARELAERRPEAVARWRSEQADAIDARRFVQHCFFLQWGALREAARQRSVALMGDVPIFVAHDSADVWASPGLFYLDANGGPACVAGVPPDYFSATGQLWGNPIYRWDVHQRTGFAWWVARLRAAFALVDSVRLDHFRGFEAFWQIPGGEETAVNGRWVKGPGAALFDAFERELGDLPIIAENLGVITAEVEQLREDFGFPGMAILQFAFGTDAQGEGFRPHNYSRNLVVYTGTHDNDTIAGWWASTGEGDSTRTAEEVAAEKQFALDYLGSDGSEVHWDFVRAVLASVADVAIVPVQDVLGLGSEARMNLPGRARGNWRWRLRPGELTAQHVARLRSLSRLYQRLPG